MAKTCSRCGIPKDKSEFNKDSKAPDGRRYECSACQQLAKRKPIKRDLTRNLQDWYTTYRPNGGECADL